jgi:hypothetical protein
VYLRESFLGRVYSVFHSLFSWHGLQCVLKFTFLERFTVCLTAYCLDKV